MELINYEEVINNIKKYFEIDLKRIKILILSLKLENDKKLLEKNIFNIYISFSQSKTLQYIKKIFPNIKENDNLNEIEPVKENNKKFSLNNKNINLNIQNIICEENITKINTSKKNIINYNSDFSNKINTEKSNINILNDKSIDYSIQKNDYFNNKIIFHGNKDKKKMTDDEINKLQDKEENLEMIELKEKIISLLNKYPNIKNKNSKILNIQISNLNDKIKEINDIEYLDNILNAINLLIELK